MTKEEAKNLSRDSPGRPGPARIRFCGSLAGGRKGCRVGAVVCREQEFDSRSRSSPQVDSCALWSKNADLGKHAASQRFEIAMGRCLAAAAAAALFLLAQLISVSRGSAQHSGLLSDYEQR